MSFPRQFLALALVAGAFSVVATVFAQSHGHDHPHPHSGAATAPMTPTGPAIELISTIPVESRIGDPSMPGTAETWVTMIDSARRHIELEHFYLSHWPGEPTGPVIDAIGRAGRRGVKVRILLDVRFQATYPSPADSLGRVTGVELRWIDMKKVSGSGVQHAKFMIVDMEHVYVGSANLDWRALKHIHELGVRVRDARIAGLYQRVFEHDWRAAATDSGPTPAEAMGRLPKSALALLPLQLIQSPGDTVSVWPTFSPLGFIPDSSLWDRDHLVRLIHSARSEIVMQALSYGSGRGSERDSTIDLALRAAATRGVKVRLLISDWQADNSRIRDLQRLTLVKNVEARLSTVPEWSGGYIPFARVEHSKFMVVDTLWTWVSTSNIEPDYFLSSRNASLAMGNRPLAFQARKLFETSWRSPTARVVNATETYAPKIHRETPPAGRKVYGK
jgi:phosphatidylserine/phosphatidylglycerophosphate/cardiolipin synthase-like enzyme